jgi:CMP-N-acetylneuraminic acid synthetase
MVNTLAIIPGRGGSKGIPRKNLRLLAGVPLIAYPILAAQQSKIVDRIVVSTDDQEIAEVARQYGAETVIRPPELSGDDASSESALLHVLELLQKGEHYHPDILVFLQCTAPLTLPEDIDGTIKALLTENADSALAVTQFHHFLWEQDETGNAIGINHNKTIRLRRQERVAQYLEAGSVYAMRTEAFQVNHHRFFGKTAMHIIPTGRVLEIDEPGDLEIANAMIADGRKKEDLDE